LRTLLVDGLGSVRTEMVGSVVETATTYKPYGEVLEQTGTSGTVYGFTGEQEDGATGLLYLRARYYNSSLKTFMSRDPWEGSPRLPQSQGQNYLYVLNNPVNYTDPTGLTRETEARCHEWPPAIPPFSFTPINRVECLYAESGVMASRLAVYWFAATAGTIPHPEGARNIRHFLLATGRPMDIDSGWLRSFATIQQAENDLFEAFVDWYVQPAIPTLAGGSAYVRNAHVTVGADEWLSQAQMEGDLNMVFRRRGIIYTPRRAFRQTEPALFYAHAGFHLQGKFEGFLQDNCDNTYTLSYAANYHFTDIFDFHGEEGLSVIVVIPHTTYRATIPDSWGNSLEDIGLGKSYEQYSDWLYPTRSVTLLNSGSIIP
jgi:RHS repeat-associated protein